MRKIIALVCIITTLCSLFCACTKPADTESGITTTDPAITPGETTTDAATSETVAATTTEAETTIPQLPADEKSTVEFSSPAICTDVGKTVDLAKYDVELKAKQITTADKLSWTTSDPDIEIKDGRYVKIEKKGVFVLKASDGKNKKDIYILSKLESESEYVLYSNDFSSMAGIDKIQQTGGSATVSNGELVLSAESSASSYVRVLFPDYLSDFTSYVIETGLKMSSPVNEKRWTSIMFNVQNNNYPYYQMAIRSNAKLSNGIELAERNSSNKWVVPYTGSFTSALKAGTEYKLMLVVNGIYAAAHINGMKVAEGTDLSNHTYGRIGLQANGCKAVYSDIKITLNTDEIKLPVPSVDVRDVTSGINAPTSMISEINNKSDLDSILTNSPAAAILNVDLSLNVLASNGSVITTVKKALEALDNKVIPVFRPKDTAAAEKIGEYTANELLTDVFVISDNADIISKARSKNIKIRGVLDFSAKTGIEPLDVRGRSNSAMANICLISSADATVKNVNFLQSLATVVWVKSNGDSIDELVRCITSGAYGVVTGDRITLEKTLTGSIFAKNTIIRPVNVIGHRGMPSIAQENTIKGSIAAVSHGANIVENDVYLTKDGVVVVMHDSTLDRTTNGSGKVEDLTYAQISQYKVDSLAGVASEPIPTLEDYMKEFKGKDVIIYIEIKSNKPEIVPAIKALIDKYDFYSQACVIAFSEEQVQLVRKTIPQISCGFLSSSLSSLQGISSSVYEYSSTFNPNQSLINKELLRDLYHRGISVWPYTINDNTKFDEFFLMGVSGITTNYANFVEQYVKTLSADKNEYSFTAGASVDTVLSALNYKGEKVDTQNAEIVVVSGNSSITFKDGKLSATEKGDACVVFRISFKLKNGQTAYVYSQPVNVSVK
ncbi:MAG: hypothetical protein J6D45_08750 [Clostridia bacterium]|nr:hypothetical protein [Clostridia bacterium]